MKILIVEDEVALAEDLRRTLEEDQYLIDIVASLSAAKAALKLAKYDLIVLDRGLPDGDGMSILDYIKRQVKTCPPILVLTAMGKTDQRVDGLDAGADDYMVKPGDKNELKARVRALLRRPNINKAQTIRLGNIQYEEAARELLINDKPLALRRGELNIAEALLRRKERVVLREHLEAAIYGFDDIVHSNSLDAQISRLRKKLNTAAAGVGIVAIRGVGYLMKEEVGCDTGR